MEKAQINSLPAVKAVVFDFDGTISTLRQGWEEVMEPLMLEQITNGKVPDSALVQKVRAYIDASTGIQTAYQMQWLKEQVELAGFGSPERDIWWYKDEYNRRLLEQVNGRIALLENGQASPADFLIQGSTEFLSALTGRGIHIYIASGTDDTDLQKEIRLLGISPFVTMAKGAPYRQTDCSKEAVVHELLAMLEKESLAVIGDGKVEIQIGRSAGARTVGLASDEKARCGINPIKQQRLQQAGAEIIVGDFTDTAGLLRFLGLQ